MTMPDVSGLPENNDALYADDPANPSRKLHQQHHDLLHAAAKALLPRTEASATYGATSTSKTAAYTAAAGDFVLADATTAGFTVTLPASPTVGQRVAVKKTDATANVMTVVATAKTIDGDPNATIVAEGAGATFVYDGTNWQILGVTSSTGPKGDTGDPGPQGDPGPAGPGVPIGGTDGQVLTKTSATDYATAWETPAAGGGGTSLTRVVLTPTDFFTTLGAPAVTNLQGVLCTRFDAVGEEAASASVSVPADWATFQAVLRWTNQSGTPGDVVWRLDSGFLPIDGATLDSTLTTGTPVTATAPASQAMATTQLVASVTNIPARTFAVKLTRVAAAVGDTHATDANLVVLLLEKVT